MLHHTEPAAGAAPCDLAPTRRAFLGAALSGAGVLALTSSAHAKPGGARDLVVFVFLRGGLDGLSLCVPHGDPDYFAHRPNLGVPVQGAIDLDGFFALAPAAAPLYDAYRDGELAFVQAVGSPDPSRSHFDAMARIESALLSATGAEIGTGWLGRALARSVESRPGVPRGVALGTVLPRSLVGGPRTLAISNPASFVAYGNTASASRRREALARMYASAGDGVAEAAIADGGRATLAALEAFSQIDFAGHVVQNGAAYPQTTFGRRLRDAAAIVRSRVGVSCLQVDFDGWDDHASMGPVQGHLAARIDELCRAIAAFRSDLGQDLGVVTLVAMSEFGRRVDENGTGGTDHGRGGLALVLGGSVHGGRVLGTWPGLAPPALDGGALAVTTDYRDLLAEVIVERYGVGATIAFPGYRPEFLGVTGA